MQEVDGLDEEEKERRIKVASRIDELLNVSAPSSRASWSHLIGKI